MAAGGERFVWLWKLGIVLTERDEKLRKTLWLFLFLPFLFLMLLELNDIFIFPFFI